MGTNYQRGYAFERRTRLAFEADGWFVIRSAGSRTKVDLVAFKGPGVVLFIQCKRGRCGPADRQSIRELATLHGAIPLLADLRGIWRLNGTPFTEREFFRGTKQAPRRRSLRSVDRAAADQALRGSTERSRRPCPPSAPTPGADTGPPPADCPPDP